MQYVKPTALLGLSTLRVRVFLQHIHFVNVSYLDFFSECIHRRCCATDGLSQHPPYYLPSIQPCFPLRSRLFRCYPLVGSFFSFIYVGPDYALPTNRTNGSVVFASGSPYDAVEFEGKVYEPGQGNNMYIFPGIGMGAILSMARHVTDSMVEQASIALAGSLTDEEKSSELVYPRLTRIRDISAKIGLAVIRAAQKDVSGSIFS